MNVKDAQGRVRALLIDPSADFSRMAELAKANGLYLLGRSSLCQAGRLLERHGPAVVLLHLVHSQQLPVSMLTDITKSTPSHLLLSLPVIEPEFAVNALLLGAKGFVRHDVTVADLLHAIRCVGTGEIWAPRRFLYAALARHNPDPEANCLGRLTTQNFTPRERQIVQRICDGLSNKEIARELSISDKTVKTHLQRIYRKHNVHSRLQLAVSR